MKKLMFILLTTALIGCSKNEKENIEDQFACECESFYVLSEEGLVGSSWNSLRPCEIELEFKSATLSSGEIKYISNLRKSQLDIIEKRHACEDYYGSINEDGK